MLLGCFLVLACTSARMVAWWLLILAPLAAEWLAQLAAAAANRPGSHADARGRVDLRRADAAGLLSLPGLQHYQPLLILRQQPRVEEDLDAVHAELPRRLSERTGVFTL